MKLTGGPAFPAWEQEIAACVRLAEETKAPFTADVIRARKDKQ